jgi:hypothetical protein
MLLSYKQRHAVWQKLTRKGLLLPLFVFWVVVALITVFSVPQGALAATSNTLNFQGRLMSSSGTLVPDGSYNIEFKIYDSASSGASAAGVCSLDSSTDDCWWFESRTITVQNGYFSVYLGDTAAGGTAFTTGLPWDQELWLTMNVNNDGEMSPRFKLTAVPYAFQAGALVDAGGNAKTADDFAQLSPAAVQTLNTAISALRLNQTGSGGLLQLQKSGADVFTVGASGDVLLKNATNTTSALDVQTVLGDSLLKIDTTNAIAMLGSASGSASTQIQGGSGGVQITSSSNVNIGVSDTNGTLLVVDTKTDAGDPPGTNGAMYYNQDSQKFRCYENGAWVDCIGGAPYAGTSVNYVSGAQNVAANQTAFALENMVFTSAAGVSNTAAVNGGFTAAADGSFRSCLVMNNANVTAGTLSLRWRVNGVSVGSVACQLNSTAPSNRQSSTVLNPGVVTFQAGDLIDIAVDTSSTYAPTTNDITVYWAIEYAAGSGGSGSGGYTLQDIYDQSLVASVLTSNNKDITFNLADTAIDSDLVVNIASGSSSRLVVQNNGTDTFSVNATGDVTASGGLTVGNSSSTSAGTIRWTGTDFEGFDGSNWLSLTAGVGGGGAGVNVVSRVKQVNESVISTNALQDDDELTFPIGPNEEWTYRFVVQANASTAADIRFAVSAPSGAVCNNATQEAENAASDAQVTCGITSSLLNGSGAAELYEITGRVLNGPTAGNVTLRWAQFTINASNTIVYAGSYVQAVRSIGAGGSGQPFAQDGNSFGETAILGTTDTQGLSIITDNVERIAISDTGEVSIAGLTSISGDLVANRTATLTTGTTSGTGSNTTALTLSADTFDVNDVILIDNVGQDYYTRVVSDLGAGSYTVSPAITFENGRTVTLYEVQNIGATSTDYSTQANRFFQGYFLGGIVVGAGSTSISDGNINSTTTLNLQRNGGDVALGGGLSVVGTITGDGSGLTNIDGAEVDGSTITSINASNISSGTLSDSRLSTNVTLLGNSFNGVNQLVQLDGTGNLPALNGSGLTNLSAANLTGALPAISGASLTSLNATNISAGTLADGRLSSNVTLLGNTFNGSNQLVQLNASGNLPALNGSGLTNLSAANLTGALPAISGASLTSLNATNISSGTLNDGRLSTNVALLTGTQTFSGTKSFSAGLSVSGGDISQTGDISATGEIAGATIVGDGSAITSLSAGNVSSGTLADGRLSSNVALLAGTQTFSGLKTFTNGVVLGQTTLTSNATVARAVSLPDEAGTICLSNTNTCGYLRLAAGSFQTDATNNDVLAVNKTSATGNLIALQRGGTPVFTVANTGALEIQSTSSSALDIRNSGGVSYFTVDTNSGSVTIGAGTSAANGVLFVLDTRTADPTGVNGGSYYNSTDNKNRCYENGIWSDCSTTRVAGETTLGAANGTINVTLNDNYEYLHCRVDVKGRSVAGGIYLRFNNVNTGNAYGWNEYDIINATIGDAQDSSDSEIQLTGTDTGNIPASADLRITNFQDVQKIVDWSYSGVTGIGTNNRRYSGTGNWNNTANFITSVQFLTSTGTFNTGSHAWCEGRNVR